jgi:uncharacterized membrane protein YjjB (DUF3815 family)
MNVVAVIPMIPGGLVAKAILGLFAIAATPLSAIRETIPTVLAHALRVAFVVFVLGNGLAIPTRLDDAAHAGARTPQMIDPELAGWTGQP